MRSTLTCDKIRQRIVAWLGHVRHADSGGLRRQLLHATIFRRTRYEARLG